MVQFRFVFSALLSGFVALPLLLGCDQRETETAETITEPRPPIVIDDLTDDFTIFFEETAGLDTGARIEVFEEQVAPLFPEFYFQDGMNTRTRHAWYALGFQTYPDLQDDFELRSDRLRAEIRPIIEKFADFFPDYQQGRPVMLVNSLGLFRARARSFRGRTYFMVGVDGMAAFHKWDNDAPFIHQELFHIYHENRFQDCQELWCFLWSEGLATLVSETLTPNASDQELMIDNPPGTIAQVDANLAVALQSLGDELEVTNSVLYRSLFFEGNASGTFPERYGYYLGYRIMREVNLEYGVLDLAELPPVVAKPIFLKAYTDLLRKAQAGEAMRQPKG